MQNDVPDHQFWMVYGIGQGGPTKMHDSAEAARAEAIRLAKKNPDVVFVVLEATSAVVKRDVDYFVLRKKEKPNNDDGIPF